MRKPVVDGRFYPATKEELLHTVEEYFKENQSTPQVEACAVIVPHAGYVYSGELAAKTLRSVRIPETVLLIGPNHTGQGAPASLSTDIWFTPLGSIPVNTDLAKVIAREGRIIVVDEAAHSHEHSLEVQLPFLQRLQQNLSIVPLTISHVSYENCEEIAESIYRSLIEYEEKILIVASSDMSHYESRPVAELKDRLALGAIMSMEPLTLYSVVHENKISMCGVIPVVITLLICQKMGAKAPRLLDYMDSGTVSGDTDQVVGYAGVIIQ